MSDFIHHECGIALVRLLKPLEYYLAKYGTAFYGLNKLHLLMEKQHNRGQDGAGVAAIKFDLEPGNRFIHRLRSNADSPIQDIFSKINKKLKDLEERNPQNLLDIPWLKQNIDFMGELYLGHLRYGTFGKNSSLNLHPFVRENNWLTKNLVVAGNFNLTNVEDLFNKLIDLGQYPIETSDTITILEKIGHFLDEENEELYRKFKEQGFKKREITYEIARQLNVQKILRKSAKYWDGGYVIAGMFGHGDAFVMRDPSGIRPAFYFSNDEIVVVTSERPVIQTVLNVDIDTVLELKPGHALIIKKDGKVTEKEFTKPLEKRSCSFERIYFSRGTDKDIYQERKRLGKFLAPDILKAIDYDLENTVFSYIPNTAIDAYYGLIEELGQYCNRIKADRIIEAGKDLSRVQLEEILKLQPRAEKVAVKDLKLRTFITQDSQRDDLAAHVYDVTWGSIRPGKDNLVVLDDSIVRGTTLKQSIIRILSRLGPRKIVIASSAPQIRYPDCYGIDMAKISDFIAFKAAIALLKETHQEGIINSVYKKAKAQQTLPKEKIVNYVKEIYAPFAPEKIAGKVAELVTPAACPSSVSIVYQTIDDLHKACPGHTGDWYFTGNYPTPGGNKVSNKAFINYIEGKDVRAY
ncbi:MAG: amidophosphoribosyltransferase [Bacteroidetes bacterium]|nr:amidophosphoribosyltransferase [Bacteroidota bacterium]